MANPPGTIGPFTNVPQPGSPMRSDWPIQASTLITQLLAREVKVYGPPGALASSVTLTSGFGFVAQSITLPASPAASRLIVVAAFRCDASGTGDNHLSTQVRFEPGGLQGMESPTFVKAGGYASVMAMMNIAAPTASGDVQFVARHTGGSATVTVSPGFVTGVVLVVKP